MSLKISVITVSYNSEETIRDTLESVLSQDYKNYEHIIVDGKSSDNTIKIVKEYEKKYKGKLKYISEKDKGLYDAMNKGIKMASGDIIGLLNSDDVFASPHVLSTIVKTIEKNDCDGVHADLLYVSPDLKQPKRKWIAGDGKIKNGWMPAHPTLYLKKEVYDKKGLYNLKYKIVSDFDFIVRICTDPSIELKYIHENLIYMRLGGLSSDGLKGYSRNIKEANQILKDNNVKFSELVIFKRILRTIMQIIKAKLMGSIK